MKKPNRQNISASARSLGISRGRLSHYLALEGAPRPDKRGRYDVLRVAAYLAAAAPRLSVRVDPRLAEIKMRILALDAEEREHRMASLRNETIDREEMTETVTRLFTELFAAFRQRFVDELPAKYQGKTEVERRQLNQAAFNSVAEEFRNGKLPERATPNAA